MDSLVTTIAAHVAFLRSLYLIHQNSHWKTKGPMFYGDHLMYQRLYESAQGNADALAEKLIGVFGSDALPLPAQIDAISKISANYASDDVLSNSLRAEKDFLEYFGKLIPRVSNMPGIDDLARSIYSDREEAIYLLRQRSSG